MIGVDKYFPSYIIKENKNNHPIDEKHMKKNSNKLNYLKINDYFR